jgi:hypothetical protein
MWVLGFTAACIGAWAYVCWLLWLFSDEHMDAVLDRDYAHAQARLRRRLERETDTTNGGE